MSLPLHSSSLYTSTRACSSWRYNVVFAVFFSQCHSFLSFSSILLSFFILRVVTVWLKDICPTPSTWGGEREWMEESVGGGVLFYFFSEYLTFYVLIKFPSLLLLLYHGPYLLLTPSQSCYCFSCFSLFYSHPSSLLSLPSSVIFCYLMYFHQSGLSSSLWSYPHHPTHFPSSGGGFFLLLAILPLLLPSSSSSIGCSFQLPPPVSAPPSPPPSVFSSLVLPPVFSFLYCLIRLQSCVSIHLSSFFGLLLFLAVPLLLIFQSFL